jgi:hypothetical protein
MHINLYQKNMKTKFRLIAFILLEAALPAMLCAQWSDNPAENTMVRDTLGMLVVPHVASRESGDTYISWYSATDGLRFDVYLQRFDAAGNKLWDDRGLMISNHETDTWVTDYSLATDHEGNAILALQDFRDGFSNAFAYRVSPEGQMKWGDDGIRLSNDTDFNPWPQVLISNDDNYIFMYSAEPADTSLNSSIRFKKVNQDGALVWGENVIADEVLDYFLPQMLLTEEGNFMISWLTVTNEPDTVMGQENYMHVMLKKFDTDGQPLWPNPVQVDTGNILLYGALYTLPYLPNAGNDGAYIMWQSFWLGEPTVLVDHVDAQGQLLWAENGVQVEIIEEQYSSEASMCFSRADNSLYVFFRNYSYDAINLADCWAVGGQKFSPDGVRIWGDSAKMVVPFLCNVDTIIGSVNIKNADDGNVCFFYEKEYLSINGTDTLIQTDLYAGLLDAGGNYLWPDGRLLLSNATSNKGHFTAGDYSSGQWITAWEDNRKNPDDDYNTGIYAQNITIDGNLGTLSVNDFISHNSKELSCYPVPFNDRITVSYYLPQRTNVIINVFDLQGRCLNSVSAGNKEKGPQSVEIETGSLVPGIYFLEMQAGDYIGVLKIMKCK